MRFAIAISPSRVSSSTVPISRMYMRTGIGRAAELGVDGRRERSGGFLGRFVVGHDRLAHQQRLGVRCLLVHRDAHVVDHLHDVFDLLRIDDLARQVVVDLRVGQEALLLAARDQQLELRLAVLGRGRRQPDFELLGAGARARLAGLARGSLGGGSGAWRSTGFSRGSDLGRPLPGCDGRQPGPPDARRP